MAATTFAKQRNAVLWKKNFSLRLNTVNCKEKISLGSNYFESQSFFMSCPFTKIFVHLLIIAAVSSFSVFKLIGWDQANTCLKSTIETLENGVNYVQS